MDTTGTVVLIVVLLLLLLLLAWGLTTRSALQRMRELATGAAAQVERQRTRRDELQAATAAAPDDTGARRALVDSQRRLDGDVAFHVAGVRAYNARLGKAPASLVASVAGLHPLPEPDVAAPAVVAPAEPRAAEPRAAEQRAAEPQAGGATRAAEPRAAEPRAGGATRADAPRD
ncbi:hypothetical protein NUM3379_38270 [Kineococcus sp. NUM-3379]